MRGKSAGFYPTHIIHDVVRNSKIKNMHFNSNPRILYIENPTNSCDLVGQMLWVEKYNCDFTIANTPSQALFLIDNQPFDLYILEYRLPEMTGVELCRQIRKTDRTTPILFFTVVSRTDDRDVALAAGANEYLLKPYDLPNLVETVKRLIAQNRGAAVQPTQIM